jgi:hypothetical protein
VSYRTEQFPEGAVFVLPDRDHNRSIDLSFARIREKFRAGDRSYIGLQKCSYAMTSLNRNSKGPEPSRYPFPMRMRSLGSLASDFDAIAAAIISQSIKTKV